MLLAVIMSMLTLLLLLMMMCRPQRRPRWRRQLDKCSFYQADRSPGKVTSGPFSLSPIRSSSGPLLERLPERPARDERSGRRRRSSRKPSTSIGAPPK